MSQRVPRVEGLWIWLHRIIIFHLVCVAWIFFRAQSLRAAWAMLKGTHPKTAAKLAEVMKADELIRLSRSITLRLNPLNLGPALEAVWSWQAEGKEKEGRDLLNRLAFALGRTIEDKAVQLSSWVTTDDT